MNMKKYLLLLILISCAACIPSMGQERKGCIINIEGADVYLDLTNAQVKAGDRVTVYKEGGYMTHPGTGKRIKKVDTVLGELTVSEAYAEYSVAKAAVKGLLPKLKAGMQVRAPQDGGAASTQQAGSMQPGNPPASVYESMQQAISGQAAATAQQPVQQPPGDERVSVVVAPAQVNDVVDNGHFGGYVADILMEQLLMCDKVRLLDRSVLNAQVSEINLQGSIIDPSTAIRQGKVLGARYILQTTMQKPDVANVRTGVPLASIMGAVQGMSGTNIGAAYASNVNVATLKAQVSLSVRVVDLQTGEVVFMCSGNGKAKGKSQLSLEYGALGGGELNGGAEDFKQTVTGKAIQQAFIRIGRNLNDFFNGRTDRKVVGSVSGGISYGDKMYAKGSKLYLNSIKLDKDEIANAFNGHSDMYFTYKKGAKLKKASWWVGIGGSLLFAGIGAILTDNSKDEASTSYAIIGVGVAGSVGCAIWMNKAGQKKINQAVDAYNTSNTYSYAVPGKTRQMSLSLTPTGLRFTF